MSDLRGIAKHLEGFGRYGDTELVHLNPIEVDMLKSLSPTGELTTNPDTGLQEAFLPLLASMFAPMLAGSMGIPTWLAGAGLGGLSSAIMGDNPLTGALMGGVGGAANGLFKGAGSAGKVAEKMAAMDAPSIAMAAPNFAPPAAGGMANGLGGMIAKHPMMALGGAGLAGMAMNGGFGGGDGQSQPMQDISLPAPTMGGPRSVIPLQNTQTYGIDGPEQNFFRYS